MAKGGGHAELGGQRPISLEYQIYPPSYLPIYDTPVTGMDGLGWVGGSRARISDNCRYII